MPRPAVLCHGCNSRIIARAPQVTHALERYHRGCAIEAGWVPPATGRRPTGRGKGSPAVMTRLSIEQDAALRAVAKSRGVSAPTVVIDALTKAGVFPKKPKL